MQLKQCTTFHNFSVLCIRSSIAKFPKDGYLVTQTLKDQGKHDFCGSIKFMYCGCTIEGRTK